MARANKTRDGSLNQKRRRRIAVIPFVEADVVANSAAGSVFVQLPERVMSLGVTSNVTTASGTANATVDVLVGSTVVVNELAVAAANVGDETLVAAGRYFATGGELIIKSGAVAPADGALIGELTVEYVELDRVSGEMTQHLIA